MLLIAAFREALGSGTLGSLALFPAPPLPLMAGTAGGFLATAAAMVLFRLANAGTAS
jgi:hypothetical protein